MLPRRSPTAPMKCDERRDARTVERFRAGSRHEIRNDQVKTGSARSKPYYDRREGQLARMIDLASSWQSRQWLVQLRCLLAHPLL